MTEQEMRELKQGEVIWWEGLGELTIEEVWPSWIKASGCKFTGTIPYVQSERASRRPPATQPIELSTAERELLAAARRLQAYEHRDCEFFRGIGHPDKEHHTDGCIRLTALLDRYKDVVL